MSINIRFNMDVIFIWKSLLNGSTNHYQVDGVVHSFLKYQHLSKGCPHINVIIKWTNWLMGLDFSFKRHINQDLQRWDWDHVRLLSSESMPMWWHRHQDDGCERPHILVASE